MHHKWKMEGTVKGQLCFSNFFMIFFYYFMVSFIIFSNSNVETLFYFSPSHSVLFSDISKHCSIFLAFLFDFLWTFC